MSKSVEQHARLTSVCEQFRAEDRAEMLGMIAEERSVYAKRFAEILAVAGFHEAAAFLRKEQRQ